MKIQGKQLYVSMQCTCKDINMAELRESGESMQFLKVIEHANARHNKRGNRTTNLWQVTDQSYNYIHPSTPIFVMHKAGIGLLP